MPREASQRLRQPDLAWSSDDDTTEVEPPHRGSPLVWSALIALVVAIAGALIFLGTTYFGSHDSKPVVPAAQPTSSTVPIAAPPPAPSTVTVTAEAPPAPSAVAPTTTTASLSDTDDAFLTQMKSTRYAPTGRPRRGHHPEICGIGHRLGSRRKCQRIHRPGRIPLLHAVPARWVLTAR